MGHRVGREIITIEETYGGRRFAETEDYLEEAFGNGDAILAYGLMVYALIENRTADDIDVAIAVCPMAAARFKFVPVAFVESVALWTAVGVEEGFYLCLLAPAVVAGRAHMTAVIAALDIVEVGGARRWNLLILSEFNAFTIVLSFGVGRGEMPCHPVRDACCFVIG